MTKITIPLASVEIGGALNAWYYNNCVLRSDVSKNTDGINAIAEDNFELSIGEVANVLAESGEVEGYLMAVQAPIAIMDTTVPEGLPKRLTLDGTATEVPKTFKHWLVPGAEIWKKDDDTEIIFYTNPFAGNEDDYLKGSEIALINALGGSVQILTIEQAETETGTGWTKL